MPTHFSSPNRLIAFNTYGKNATFAFKINVFFWAAQNRSMEASEACRCACCLYRSICCPYKRKCVELNSDAFVAAARNTGQCKLNMHNKDRANQKMMTPREAKGEIETDTCICTYCGARSSTCFRHQRADPKAEHDFPSQANKAVGASVSCLVASDFYLFMFSNCVEWWRCDR